MKWQYDIDHIREGSKETLDDWNARGADGWEMVGADRMVAVFKRPITVGMRAKAGATAVVGLIASSISLLPSVYNFPYIGIVGIGIIVAALASAHG